MATTDSEQNSYVRQETSFPDDLHVRMKRIWLNEQYSPELLPFEKDIVNEFLHRLEIQQQKVAASPQTVDTRFIFNLYQMELERMKYLVVSYLRIRLIKIEKWCSFLLTNENERIKMSEKELEYAKGYNDILSTFFKETFLNELPDKLQSLTEQSPVVNMIPQPNLSTHVICRVLETVDNYSFDSLRGEQIKMTQGDIYAVRYQMIKDLLLENKIELI